MGHNMVEHEAEIFSRPARTWFQSGKEKQASKSAYFVWFPCTPWRNLTVLKRRRQRRLRWFIPVYGQICRERKRETQARQVRWPFSSPQEAQDGH